MLLEYWVCSFVAYSQGIHGEWGSSSDLAVHLFPKRFPWFKLMIQSHNVLQLLRFLYTWRKREKKSYQLVIFDADYVVTLRIEFWMCKIWTFEAQTTNLLVIISCAASKLMKFLGEFPGNNKIREFLSRIARKVLQEYGAKMGNSTRIPVFFENWFPGTFLGNMQQKYVINC